MSLLAVGFFGEGNLGDAAILEGIRQLLPPGVRLSATAGMEAVPTGVVRARRKGLAAWPVFLREARKADRIVLAGGILQDWSMDGVLFFALRLLAAERLGRPAELWGAGLGPLRGFPLRQIAARALRQVGFAWLRDQPSVDLFRDLTGRTARLGTDWSWALEATPLKSAPEADGATGINLRPWSDPNWEMAVAALPAAHGPAIGIAARAEDARLWRRLEPDQPCFQPERFGELLTFCGRLREGWAMRYHVLLAMLRAGLPTVALPYDDKVTSLAREAGLPLPDGLKLPVACTARADFRLGHSARWREMSTAFVSRQEAL